MLYSQVLEEYFVKGRFRSVPLFYKYSERFMDNMEGTLLFYLYLTHIGFVKMGKYQMKSVLITQIRVFSPI